METTDRELEEWSETVKDMELEGERESMCLNDKRGLEEEENISCGN